MSYCPVCQTEYVEEEVKYCSSCGWDLTPYPLTFGLPDELVSKEQAKLAWAKEMWKRKQDETAVRQSEQEQFQQERTLREAAFIQLQSQVTEVQAKLQQVQQEQSELLIQLKKSQSEREKSEQERILREAALIQLQSQVTEIQAKLHQVEQERSDLQIQLEESKLEWEKSEQERTLREAKFIQLQSQVTKIQAKLKKAQQERSELQIQLEKSLQEHPKLKPEIELLPPIQFHILSAKEFHFDIITVNSKGKETNRRRGSARQTIENLGIGVSLEMVYIPGGTFMMGSPGGNVDDLEKPQHRVIIQPFFMGKFTVTQEQYQAVMGTNPSHFPGKKRPVECVSWDNAVEFCAKLSKQTGKKYHLPSEAQWEYACRAGVTAPFHFGQTITTDLANYDGNHTYGSTPKDNYRQETTNVGSFPANAFGLHDMHGNVEEWCEDNWHNNYVGAPSDGSSWISSNDPFTGMLRGGSWSSHPASCRSAYRRHHIRFFRYNAHGFRVVSDVSSRT